MHVELEEATVDVYTSADLSAKLTAATIIGQGWPIVRSALAPIIWKWFDDNRDDVIYRIKAKIKLLFGLSIRPSISLYVRDLRPLIQSIFGAHP